MLNCRDCVRAASRDASRTWGSCAHLPTTHPLAVGFGFQARGDLGRSSCGQLLIKAFYITCVRTKKKLFRASLRPLVLPSRARAADTPVQPFLPLSPPLSPSSRPVPSAPLLQVIAPYPLPPAPHTCERPSHGHSPASQSWNAAGLPGGAVRSLARHAFPPPRVGLAGSLAALVPGWRTAWLGYGCCFFGAFPTWRRAPSPVV